MNYDDILVSRRKISELGARNNFERDYTAILYSHAFRRLKHKTQVFLLPMNDHVTNRLDHSLYVAIISKVICRNLGLNGQLADAIALGHDLGHSPFGHAGEKVLNILSKDFGGFSHEMQSLRVVDKLEKAETDKPIFGLNLTLAVRDGIVNHCGESFLNELTPSNIPEIDKVGIKQGIPCTLEGCVVRLVDKIAYMGRDIEDGIIAGLISKKDIPEDLKNKVGSDNGEIVDFFVRDIIKTSTKSKIALSKNGSEYLNKFMKFNYNAIYLSEKNTDFTTHTERLLKGLFNILLEYSEKYKDNFDKYMKDSHNTVNMYGKFLLKRNLLYFVYEDYPNDIARYKRAIIDFIASSTDRLAYEMIKDFFIPNPVV
ncbi:MAG: dNTP triphosphohydrolase [Candidatus Muirbacterium halophilum]|nr:dNTP triphosphohydrolase [Candidatus Muirbacterium halophilum]MCK9477046.1 dNTP triphosphohydrolase [Candidatus Muirbacterium halophilum]